MRTLHPPPPPPWLLYMGHIDTHTHICTYMHVHQTGNWTENKWLWWVYITVLSCPRQMPTQPDPEDRAARGTGSYVLDNSIQLDHPHVAVWAPPINRFKLFSVLICFKYVFSCTFSMLFCIDPIHGLFLTSLVKFQWFFCWLFFFKSTHSKDQNSFHTHYVIHLSSPTYSLWYSA